MKYIFYGIAIIFFWCEKSEAMECTKYDHTLGTLANTALSKVKEYYEESNEDVRKTQNLQSFIQKALADICANKELNTDNLPVMSNMLQEGLNVVPRLYNTVRFELDKDGQVNTVDMSADGKKIFAGVGNKACIWVNKDGSWRQEDYTTQKLPIRAVCLAGDNGLVTLDTEGTVFLLSYDGWDIKQQNAFRLADSSHINMIALNDAQDRLVCGSTEEAQPLCVYKRTVAHWNKEKAEIPIHEVMEATALQWASKATIIAYGKIRGYADDKRMLTEWKRSKNVWQCMKKIDWDLADEQKVLATQNYILTRREPKKALDASGITMVAGSSNILIIGKNESPENDLVDDWQDLQE